MARAPYQVLIMPFLRSATGMSFAALERSDIGAWQGIAGGGEPGETITATARREIAEETGITSGLKLYRLQATASIPDDVFSGREGWPADLYVIPEYSFGLDCTGLTIRLSAEHRSIRWGSYEDLARLLTWDSNRVALWELKNRLENDDLVPADEIHPGRN